MSRRFKQCRSGGECDNENKGGRTRETCRGPKKGKVKFLTWRKGEKKKIVSDFKALNHPEKKNLYSNSVLEVELP